jgi:hypothetical protein
MPSKSHLINEPPKQVYQIPPFQIKQILKDLIKFSKFRYGRGVMVTYWVGHVIFLHMRYDRYIIMMQENHSISSMRQLINMRGAHSRKERRHPLIFSSRIQGMIQELIEDKLKDPNHAFTQDGDKVTINRLMTKWICIQFGAELPSL